MSVKNRFVRQANQLGWGSIGQGKQRRPYWRRAHAVFTSSTAMTSCEGPGPAVVCGFFEILFRFRTAIPITHTFENLYSLSTVELRNENIIYEILGSPP